ncbi:uncharacterized protein LOC107217371 [Neodiprion lecontei]|uniref:Uncharacterized protein LOC107217371 n=1 Tax=Neodiprion lecontei TaxID=441921 RepID=A0ABM3G3I5_NEOLC|nr:uncharacterized protein LOC107217371 [Neodiprion lecontei]XP_046594829.1 uncharacterized protein LOC107217371 [Neodiprion lecontei]
MKMMSDVVAVNVDDGSPINSSASASSSKEFRERTLRSLKKGLGRLWRRHRGNASITEYDPSYKVAYLGNVLTGWAKGEGCVEKPVATLWRNYVGSSRPDVSMRLTVTCGGLTATTRDHGLTEYWAHRITYCTAPSSHPRLVVWVYRHEGRRLRPELRCHAALCSTESTARRLASTLNARLQQALMEFRRDKVSRQNARLSLANSVYENPSLPRRKILLSTGGQNYKPPLERSKSAPKLSAIEEDAAAEELEQARLLEELRTLRSVASSWPDQDHWRLARLVEALNRGNCGEFSDENGSISSGCETASTANSEERAPGNEDSNNNSECAEPRSPRRVYFSDEGTESGLRRNSDGSPNFMTCTGSPKFKLQNRKIFATGSEPGHVFDFEDVEEDFCEEEDLVDCSPRGEHPRRPQLEAPSRERRLKRADTFPSPGSQLDLHEEDEFSSVLDALDEEADSDESGYVEAPPKALLLPSEGGAPKKVDRDSDEELRERIAERKSKESKRPTGLAEDVKSSSTCPISETIKKLANVSVKTSKSLDISTNNCPKTLNGLKSSKSFDSSPTIDEQTENFESPSLLQRKKLLAQQGVKV